MENLGRGIVAVRAQNDSAFISWRLLGLDPEDIAFNIYRSTDGANATRLNSEPLTGGTNYLDSGPDLSRSNEYWVRYTLQADTKQEPLIRVPIRSGDQIKYVWVGDLDGSGEYGYVVDRHGVQQSFEAYRSNGEFLWEVSMGPNSENQNNIEPGSAAIDVGHWDGLTVYDLDSDGFAEVIVRIANGVVFGDGAIFDEGSNDDEQFIAVLDGQTGALRASISIPNDYIEHGPFAARLGIGYLDGTTPHIVGFMKNRRDDKQDLTDTTRAFFDVDGDGVDEVGEIMFLLEGNGTMRYSLTDSGIGHGDRWQVAKIDPERPGLQGYGVQQDNPSKLWEYYYDARTGEVLWKHYGDAVGDIGRGMIGDIDPNHPGMESWSAGENGLYNAPSNSTITNSSELAPWAHLGLWWDGDDTMELYNDGKVEKWNPEAPTTSSSLPRLFRISDYGAVNPGDPNPAFLGDIFGDWREEVITTNEDMSELIIFTTDQPTKRRLYTLAHNPNYRNGMTLKGYLQNAHVDYFIGNGMETPPQPNIRTKCLGTGTALMERSEPCRLLRRGTIEIQESSPATDQVHELPPSVPQTSAAQDDLRPERAGSPQLKNIHAEDSGSLTKRQSNGTENPPVFFRDNNVWYRDSDGREVQMSTTGTEDSPFSNITYPSPNNEFVVVFQSTPGQDHIVYEVESSPYDQLQPRLHQFQYLKPGDNVTIDRPRMFDLTDKREVATDNTLFENPYQLYSLDGGWNAEGTEFRFIYNQRGHQVVRIVGMSTNGHVRALVEEKSDTFVDYSQKLYYKELKSSNSSELIWASERDGWNHLYLYDMDSGKVKNQITKGEWVVRSVDYVDEMKRQIWIKVLGAVSGQDPYYAHLARVNFDGSDFKILTEGDGDHSWYFNDDRSTFTDTWSRMDMAEKTVTRDAETGNKTADVYEGNLDSFSGPYPSASQPRAETTLL
ncbi:unnamed protein product [Alternaria alternata]